MRADRACRASWELLGCVSIPLEKRLGVFKATINATVTLVRRIMELDEGAQRAPSSNTDAPYPSNAEG